MPPRRSSSKKKKEVLPDPDTLPNGNCNHYIGTWSSYEEIDAISDIAHALIDKHTQSDGEVAPLPRTCILIPPCELGSDDMRYSIEVSDNMHIESVPKASVKGSTNVQMTLENGREQEEDMEQNGTEETAATPERAIGSVDQARDVVVHGALHIDGIITPIVIKPVMPEPVAPPKTRRKSVKGKKDRKTTEEEQKRLEEEARIYEEKVNAAIAAARAEGERLMQYAHPDRWPSVEFVNMTFAGQVIVSHAHVKFHNCYFTASKPGVTQLLVAQYCRVECVRCTFECPVKGSVYGWPTGKITIRKCLFTGVPLASIGDEEATAVARQQRSMAVGLHVDDCGVFVEDSHFVSLGTGVILRGSAPGPAADEPGYHLTNCKVESIFSTGVLLENVNGVKIQNSSIKACEYYALDCAKGRAIALFNNNLQSVVRVQKGVEATFLHNKTGTIPFDLKEIENPNWRPVY